jgi:hypothetical protein
MSVLMATGTVEVVVMAACILVKDPNREVHIHWRMKQ